MIIRQQKRWCGKCRQNVFARGHEHGLEVVPPDDVRNVVYAVELRNRVARALAGPSPGPGWVRVFQPNGMFLGWRLEPPK